ncbi:MAG: ATP-binding protein [Anaerolineales bacterium]|jgi:DNA replication protein DnaC
MSEKIEETLKRLAADTSRASSQTSGTPEPETQRKDRAGDPNCPHCHGSGYLRDDLPLDHPEFGRLRICICRQSELHSRVRDRLFSLSQLDKLEHLTFDSFNPRGRVGLGVQQQESIEKAYNLAQTFADERQGWLLLLGGYGVGKTHLAAAVGNQAVEEGIPTLFLTVPDLLDQLRFAYGAEDETFEARFERVRTAPLLIMDDFGTQSATPWAREKLFQILNYRYINHLPTVVTTNLALEQIEGRMRSRLSDPELVSLVTINAPDYRRPTDDSGQHELSTLSLHAGQTFGTFSLRKDEGLSKTDLKTLDSAFQLAQGFAERPEGWLVLMGPYGSGKTHLASAIANYRASQGFPVMFVVVPDMLDHLRSTFSPNSETSYDRRFDEIRTAPLLILDDMGSQAAKPWVHEKLYQLYNYRYNAELPTVITTADALEEIDPRLRARLLDRRLVRIAPITVPAYRGGPPKSRR